MAALVGFEFLGGAVIFIAPAALLHELVPDEDLLIAQTGAVRLAPVEDGFIAATFMVGMRWDYGFAAPRWMPRSPKVFCTRPVISPAREGTHCGAVE